MLATSRAAAVAGSGCSLAEDTDLRAGTTRHYTLSATAAEAGKVTCTITVGTASHTITIDFIAPPPPTTPTPTPEPEPTGGELAAPGNLGCTWHTQGNERVVCAWDEVTGATRGYRVKYELTYRIRGTTRNYARQRPTTSTRFSSGVNKYVTATKLQVAAKGPNGPGPYTEWAAAIRLALAAPTGVSAVCGSDGVLSVSWGHRGPLVPLNLRFEVEIDGSELGEERRSAWSVPVTVNKCAVFKPDGFAAA